jgi:hypothetical protein
MCFGPSGGAFPGLVIGVVIIIVGVVSVFGGNFGMMMGRWGENFGESMGRWGEGVGRFFADWGMSWASRFGASIMIIVQIRCLHHDHRRFGHRILCYRWAR